MYNKKHFITPPIFEAPPPAGRAAAKLLLMVVFTLFSIAPHLSHARGFGVTDVEAEIATERLEIEFDLDLSLSDPTIEALHHGIELYLIVEVELRRSRRFMPDVLLEKSRRDVEIRFHGLSRRYVVQETGVGAVSSHLTIAEALEAIAIDRQVLIPVPELPTNQSIEYVVAIRTRLNAESLPSPLRLISRLRPAWRLDSGWTKWPVRY